MGRVRIRHYVVRNGRGYWQPTARMKAAGFRLRSLGADGPDAWAAAERLNRDWDGHRLAGVRPQVEPADATPETAEAAVSYPRGSVGEAFQRYLRLEEWRKKAPGTRDKIWWPAWRRRIRPYFGDLDPMTVTLEDMSLWRQRLTARDGVDATHKAVKVWRALWTVMAAMHYCERGADPSRGMRNVAPQPRHQTWSEGETVRLVKAAIRHRYHGLAAIIGICWDTQFSPVDARSIRQRHLRSDAAGLWFDLTAEGRAKTGRATIGTTSRRTARLVDAYLAALGLELLEDAYLFRNRSKSPYSQFTLADDFAAVRELAFPGDRRRLMDMRRSGTVEAVAGDATASSIASKMANSIDTSSKLHKTYAPVDRAVVISVDDARRRGRRRLRKGAGDVGSG